MNVKEVMVKKVATCHMDTPLNSIAMTMWNNDCGCVPVVDEQNKPVGMVTDRDIAIGAALQHKPLWEITARDITNGRPVYNCGSGDDVHQVLDLMREHSVRRLPVVNRQGKLAGIVSFGDVIASADTSANAELPFSETAGMLKAVSGHHSAQYAASLKTA